MKGYAMADIRLTKTNGGEVVLAAAAVDELASGLLGNLLRAGDGGYDEARTLWNAMIDRKPALIARCAGAADVIACVRFARKHGLLLSVKGGGHNVAGKASADGSLMVDLSRMNLVRVDPAAKLAWVGAGATLHAVDHETAAYGLVTPLGINSTTGVAGLTLGGGFGWLSRSLGLTADNLEGVDLVTAEGNPIHVSASEHPDLFWALRGGSGNFGIVTNFQLRLHQLGPTLLCGLIIHSLEDAAGGVFKYYRDFAAKAPDKLSCWFVLRKAPPLPFLPAESHGTDILVMAVVYAGEIAEGEKLLKPLRSFGKPLADITSPMPYAGFQQAFDPLLAPGARNYWKTNNFKELPDALLDTLMEHARKLPSPICEIACAHVGGAVNRIPADATAYPHRDAKYVMNVHTRWEDPAMDAACVAWARSLYDATSKYATGGIYVNFISEGDELVPNAYGGNLQRLADVKKKYDPTNFFRTNQNIIPRS